MADFVNGTYIGDAGDILADAANVALDSDGDGYVDGDAGYGSDSDDYYTFTAAESGTASIYLGGMSADLDLHLYNSAGNRVASSNGISDERIDYSVIGGSTYYVKVDPYGLAESDYFLGIDAPESSVGSDDYVKDPTTGIWYNVGDVGDVLADATDVTFDSNGLGRIAGSAGYGSDSDDYYQFTAVASGTASIYLDLMSADLDLHLYNSAGNRVASSTNGGSSTETLDYSVTAGSTYYVRVDPYGSAESNYGLDIYSPVSSAGSDDYIWNPDTVNWDNIGDAGNTLSNAANVTLSSSGRGDAYGSAGYGSDSDDYYQFTAVASGTAEISLTGMSEDLDLFVYDSAGNRVASSNGTSDESLSYSVTGGSTYYVQVDPYGTAESDYYLNMATPVASSGMNDVVYDPNSGSDVDIGDAGNTLSNAANVTLNSNGNGSAYGSAGYGSDSDDYYQFTALGSGTATMELDGIYADLDIRLYNSVGTLLSSSTAGGSTAESITYGVTAGITYYVRVDPYIGAESNYYLYIDAPVSSAGSDDYVYNPNTGIFDNIGDAGDTLADAANVTLDSTGYGFAYGSAGYGSDSDDYYQFTALGSGTATIDLGGGMSEDLDLFVYDSAGNQVASSTGTSDETLSYTVNGGSTYYVRVDPYGSAESDYQLTIDAPEASSSDLDDYVYDHDSGWINIGDAGDTQAAAAYVTLDSDYGDGSANGSAGYGSDSDDYYQFTALGSGAASIYLNGMSADLDLRLYNSAGTLLSSSTAGGSTGESISYTVNGGSTYYVRVDPYNAAESNYLLDIYTPVASSASEDYVNGSNIGDAGDTLGSAAYVDILGEGYYYADVDGSTGYSSDSGDYYKFELYQGEQLELGLYGMSDDLDLYVYDSAGNQVAISNGYSDESIVYTVESSEMYYVRVDPYGSAESEYALDIVVAKTPDSLALDADSDSIALAGVDSMQIDDAWMVA